MTTGPGVDFWIEDAGVTIATEKGAVVKGGGIKAPGLCVGVILHGPGAPNDSVTVFLDDP